MWYQFLTLRITEGNTIPVLAQLAARFLWPEAKGTRLLHFRRLCLISQRNSWGLSTREREGPSACGWQHICVTAYLSRARDDARINKSHLTWVWQSSWWHKPAGTLMCHTKKKTWVWIVAAYLLCNHETTFCFVKRYVLEMVNASSLMSFLCIQHSNVFPINR